MYGPNADYSMFYNLKQPTRTWDYGKLSVFDRSVLDDSLYIIHEGVSFNPFNAGGYSMLFILMVVIWAVGDYFSPPSTSDRSARMFRASSWCNIIIALHHRDDASR